MLRYLLDMVGAGVFAISGALAAGRRGLDLIGVMVLGVVTAIGGGTIRDVLLNRHPIFWLADPNYLIVIIASALLTVAYVRWRPAPHSALLVADALGLALFSVVGAQIAEAAPLPAISCVLLGTVTGTAGGVVRDVLTAEVPLVLRRGNLYATAAIAGTSTYFLLEAAGVSRPNASFVAMAVCAVLRFASIWWGLKLPVFQLGDEGKALR
ncbi:MAG: trimeric intracellular cation channel family protein [bacterium]